MNPRRRPCRSAGGLSGARCRSLRAGTNRRPDPSGKSAYRASGPLGGPAGRRVWPDGFDRAIRYSGTKPGRVEGVWGAGPGPQLFSLLNVESSAGRKAARFRQLNPWRNRFIVKKIALAMLLALTLVPAASFAQVVVRVAPPAPIVEERGRPPERGFVWIDGYHRWDGGRYVWVPGRWERPPHPGARLGCAQVGAQP